MNQLPTRIGARFQLKHAGPAPGQCPAFLSAPLPIPYLARETPASEAGVGSEVTHGLQLARASTIALTRLQLALAGGDSRQAMEAIDCLHALDGEFEHLVGRLPANPAETGQNALKDPATLLRKHITDQKLALAFEKLAFASGIVGPDLVSPGARPTPGTPQTQVDTPPLVDWHSYPEVRSTILDRFPAHVWALLAVLSVIALAFAGWSMASV